MIRFGIENAEQYAEDNDLVKYEFLSCLCTLAEFGINNCQVCDGSGIYSVDIYTTEYVLELKPVLNIAGEDILECALLNALGLTEKYGEIYARKLRSRIEQWSEVTNPLFDNLPSGMAVASKVFEHKDKLISICNEAERREERVVWG